MTAEMTAETMPPSGPNAKYRPPVPFLSGLTVGLPGEIPWQCTLCTWVPLRGRHALKYAHGNCSQHHRFAGGAGH
jgi:hypothetical protein